MEKLTAIYEHTEDGWWVVSVPEIPGAHSQGRTLEALTEEEAGALAKSLFSLYTSAAEAVYGGLHEH